MTIAIYPGTFDPITLGHMDIVSRTSKIFDNIIFAIATDTSKTHLFSIEERIEMAQEELKNFSNIKIIGFSGLLVNFAKKHHSKTIIRGIRAISDFEYEFQIYNINAKLDPEIQTIFFPASTSMQFISSRIVKEVARLGGDISNFVSKNIESRIKFKYNI
jgi:pantetheine-phosphate adenylyltransferase